MNFIRHNRATIKNNKSIRLFIFIYINFYKKKKVFFFKRLFYNIYLEKNIFFLI